VQNQVSERQVMLITADWYFDLQNS